MNKTGSDLFIVDNSDTDWKVLNYLQEWCSISKSIDIASGYFEIGSLLALKDEWQKVDKIRILMGDEVSKRTKEAFEKSFATIKSKLDSSIEAEKNKNDFLAGVPAIVKAIKDGKIECRVYRKDKFHAKAYITHSRLEVVGSAALVGSSNFTYPGLSENIELNVQLTGRMVNTLQDWYETHWKDAEDVTPDMLKTIERHVREYTPFDVYTCALNQLFEHHSQTETEWEQSGSTIYPLLDQYQREGYHSMLKIGRQFNGAFMCDGVGLGKTFVGLMLIERLIMHDKKRVMLLVPKSGRVSVWERHIKKYLPHLLNGFLPFKIYNHTDLMRGKSADGRDFTDEFEQIKQQADVVIIDEAHHFRNRGLANLEDGTIRSRYWKLYDIIDTKTLYLLTATPINNSLTDFQHQIELFSRIEKPAAFAYSLGIHNLPAYFQNLEKNLKKLAPNLGIGELFDGAGVEVEQLLFEDKLFRALVVQRSRSYAQQSQLQNGVSKALFPDKADPIVQPYSVKKTYGHLLQKVEDAFSRPEQLFSLAVYYPLSKWKGDPTALDVFDENRQKQVVRLIRIQFLKRFESSIFAFEASCQTLLYKLLAFLTRNSSEPLEIKRLNRWRAQNKELLEHMATRKSEVDEEEDSEEDDLISDFLDSFDVLDRGNYDIDAIMDETYQDMEQIVDFLEELKIFNASHDNKLQSLIKLLKTDKVLKQNKVLIFSEFMSTARYLKRELIKAGIKGVDELDSASGTDRTDAIQQFAPYYNGSSSAALKEAGVGETRVLISTDVLSEGLNLQDSTRLINYDIHWNPVRLMQRIGRVDRRLNPEVEKQLIADHPDQKELRGNVMYWNFLPPDDLDNLLKLYYKVANKTLRISKVFGIEGRKLLKPEDDYEALRDFTHEYEGTLKPIEQMHLELQKLMFENKDLKQVTDAFPGRVYSGRANPVNTTKALFLCYSLPAEDKSQPADNTTPAEPRWTEEAGTTGWYLIDMASSKVIDQPEEIIKYIRSKPDTPRVCSLPQQDVREARLKVEKHIKNSYFKQVQAPLGIKATLKCWMEIN